LRPRGVNSGPGAPTRFYTYLSLRAI